MITEFPAKFSQVVVRGSSRGRSVKRFEEQSTVSKEQWHFSGQPSTSLVGEDGDDDDDDGGEEWSSGGGAIISADNEADDEDDDEDDDDEDDDDDDDDDDDEVKKEAVDKNVAANKKLFNIRPLMSSNIYVKSLHFWALLRTTSMAERRRPRRPGRRLRRRR